MKAMGSRTALFALAAVVCIAVFSSSVQANVYPSGVKVLDSDLNIQTCDPVVVQYILNQKADGDGVNPGVTIKVHRASDNAVVRTVTYPTQAKGLQTFIWDKKNDGGQVVANGSYKIEITAVDTGYSAWTKISDDASPQVMFNSPRGVTVNKNPNSPLYGRIYVSNSAAGTPTGGQALGDGIYMRNADGSDSPVGQGYTAKTAGFDWTLSTNSPWKLEIGPDNSLYISDWSNAHGGLFKTDADVSDGSGIEVLSGIGNTTNPTVHGSTSSGAIVKGDLTTGDLKVYAVDQDLQPYTSLWRWDIGAGPLPWNSAPTVVSSALINVIGVLGDLDIAPDGKIFLMQYRSAGTDAASVYVVSPDDGVNPSTVLWDSLLETRKIDPAGDAAADYLKLSRGIAVSPDGSIMAVVTDGSDIMILPLVNGLPDMANRLLLDVGTTISGRDIAFDAVGNICIVTSGHARLRIFSPPTGVHTNSTTSQTFALSGAGAGGPTISKQPASISVCSDTNATFTVTATGSGTLKYRWSKNGYEIDGQAGNGSPSVTLTAVTADDNNAHIAVSVCDNNGVTVSEDAVLTVFAVPTITTQPLSAGYRAGETMTPLTIAATSSVTTSPTLTYQWKKTLASVTTDIGTNSSTLDLGIAQVADNGAQYSCVVTDSCGKTATSNSATINILPKACNFPWADADGDKDIDQVDFGAFQLCYTGPEGTYDATVCACLDANKDNAIDNHDLNLFVVCASGSGPDVPADPLCGATVLYQDDFDGGDSASKWTLSTTSADNTVNFNFDYSTVGIPAAPRTTNGTTTGVFMSVNDIDDPDADPAEAVIAYAKTADFSGDFTLSFDLWLNYGTLNTTEFAAFGINGDGSAVVVPTLGTNAPAVAGTGPINAGYLFAVTGDGGTVRDYRTYDGVTEYLATAAGFQAASGSQDSGAAYYTALFPSPKSYIAGSPGNTGGNGWGWARVDVVQASGVLTWKINDTVIATRAASTYPSGKIMIGYMDMFVSISQAAAYVVYDNVTVTAP